MLYRIIADRRAQKRGTDILSRLVAAKLTERLVPAIRREGALLLEKK